VAHVISLETAAFDPGRNRLAPDDPLSALILATLQDEPAFAKVERRVE
jgi:hypothetical protein